MSRTKLFFVLLFAGLLASWGCSHAVRPRVSSSESITPFLGRWDLTVRTPARDYPSWIELSEAQGQPKVLTVGFWGCATPAAKAQLDNGTIEFSMPQHAEDYGGGEQFTGKLVNGQLVGTTTGTNGAAWQWTGRRAPALNEQTVPKWGKPIRLFNGRNFAGWNFSDPSKAGVWKVEHHILVKDGNGSELISTRKFGDFKLHVEFNDGRKSNSGVYLRGRYELQIETDSASDPPDQHQGAIYGFIAPNPEQPRRANVWQTFDVTLVGRTLTVVQNGTTIVDRQEIPGITGGALDSNEGSPGPIYLQGSEKGRVTFRNIVITPAV
jgi:Domain of Unknown Function (DUF1080)